MDAFRIALTEEPKLLIKPKSVIRLQCFRKNISFKTSKICRQWFEKSLHNFEENIYKGRQNHIQKAAL